MGEHSEMPYGHPSAIAAPSLTPFPHIERPDLFKMTLAGKSKSYHAYGETPISGARLALDDGGERPEMPLRSSSLAGCLPIPGCQRES